MAFEMILASEDSSAGFVHRQSGWFCDFYFGYGYDVIEEDALNEKYCIQVLSILIAKEDTEIDELEKELVSLQSELAWAKCEEWPHICCNALREKIESLQTSVRSLMSEDIAVHLLLKPAESLHDIMKALLSDFFQEKIMQNEQQFAVVAMDSSGYPGQSTELDGNKTILSPGCDVIIKEEKEEFSNPHAGSGSILETSLVLQEEDVTNTLEIVKGIGQNPLGIASCNAHQKSSNCEDTREREGKEHDFSPEKKNITSDLSLKSAVGTQEDMQLVKVKPADTDFQNAIAKILEPAVTYCKRKKPSNTSQLSSKKAANDLKAVTDFQALVSSGDPVEKDTHVSKKVKQHANAIVETVRAGPLLDETDVGERRTDSDSKLMISGKAENENSSTSCDSLSVRHPTRPIGRRNNSDPKLASSRQSKVENLKGGPAAMKHATDLNQRRKCYDPRFGGFAEENGGNCDFNQKLCDFVPKAARKRIFRDSNLTQADKRYSLDLSSLAEGTRKSSQTPDNVDLTDTKNSASTAIVELQNGGGKDLAQKLTEEEIMQLELLQAVDLVNPKKFNGISVESQNQKGKRKAEPSLLSIQDLVPFPDGSVSNSALISKARRQCKAALSSNIYRPSGSNQSPGRTTKKQFQNSQSGDEDNIAAMRKDRISNLLSQKKRNKNVDQGIVVELKGSTLQPDSSKSQSNLNGSTGKDDLMLSEAYAIVPYTTPSPNANNMLKDMNLEDENLEVMKLEALRALAKKHKITKYYKLKKCDLIEKITNHRGY